MTIKDAVRILDRNYKISVVVGLCLAGLLVYSNSFLSSFHFDDSDSIISNFYIRDIGNLKAIWYFWPTRFITYLSFALNYHIHKLDIFGYHVLNFSIHLCCAIMVWLLARITLSLPVMQNEETSAHSKPIAFFIGLVFLVHPIQTAVVNYTVQRAASLATFFYLLSLILYIKLRLSEQQDQKKAIVLSYRMAFFLIATATMFTKEIAITLPFALLLYEIFFLRIKKYGWRNYLTLLAILSVIPCVLIFCNFGYLSIIDMSGDFSSQVPPRYHYFLTQFRVMLTYIRLTFLPLNQNLDYDYGIIKTFMDLRFLCSLFFLSGITFFAIRSFHKRKLFSFGIFWFFLTILPESSIIPTRNFIFEHRLYLPMVGYAIVLVCAIQYLFGEKRLKVAVIALIFISLWYSFLTYARNYVWRDEVALWSDTINKSPKKARAYFSRGTAYFFKGEINKAMSDFNIAISINPFDAVAYTNRGSAYAFKGEIDQAIDDFNKAISIAPLYDGAYENLGNAYASKGDFSRAFFNYAKALEIKPDNPDIYFNRAVAYFLKKEYGKSWDDIYRAKKLGREVDAKFLEELRKVSGGCK